MKIHTILGSVLALTVASAFAADAPQPGAAKTDGANQSASAAAAPADHQQKLSFDEIDTDHDGYISSVEAYVAGFVVGPMDTDKDGRISKQEFEAAQSKAGQGVTGDEAKLAASESAVKEAGNDKPSSHLNDSLGQAATAPETNLSFEEVDSNGDGVISDQEASIAGLHEKEFDTNQDGKITREEYEDHIAKLRETQKEGTQQEAPQSARAGG